jgi:hypothetical protein
MSFAKRRLKMTLTRKDAGATLLTAVVVLVFVAARQGWNVPLVGGSDRWAAGVVFLLGMCSCSLGEPDRGGAGTRLLAALGVLAVVFAGLAVATGSLTFLALLVGDTVVLWALSTLRHARHVHGTAVPT